MFGCKSLGNHSLNRTFNTPSICLQYTFELEWPGFCLKCLVTVMPKGQSSTVKISVWNFPISEISSNCNSILFQTIVNELLLTSKEMQSKVGHVLLSHLYHVSIISDSCRSVPTFVSDRLSVSIRLLINRHDYFIRQQLQLSASKSDTSRSVHVFQRAINNFEILFLASISTYKPETSLAVLFPRKVFRSALKVEFTRFFIGKSYKEHQFNIFQTSQAVHNKKKKKPNLS